MKNASCDYSPAMFTNWQLFTDLGEAVKPWALLFGEQSREESEKMTEEVNPKAYPLAEQVCSKWTLPSNVLTSDHQALTTKILNLVQQAANYKQLRKVTMK